MASTSENTAQFPVAHPTRNTLQLSLQRMREQAVRKNTPIEHPDRLENGAIAAGPRTPFIPKAYFKDYSEFGIEPLLLGIAQLVDDDQLHKNPQATPKHGDNFIADIIIDAGDASISEITKQCTKNQIPLRTYFGAVRNIYQTSPRAWRKVFTDEYI